MKISEFNGLNPLKRVNSILTGIIWFPFKFKPEELSQSPQTGQFNSYLGYGVHYLDLTFDKVSIPSNGSIQFLLLLIRT